jgi:hypothetical protein
LFAGAAAGVAGGAEVAGLKKVNNPPPFLFRDFLDLDLDCFLL